MRTNPLAWTAWSLAALGVALVERNPFIQVVLFLVVIGAWLPYRRRAPDYWRIAAALALLPVAFSVVFSRFGSHVLFSLPNLPVVGGPWTLEAVLYGLSTGMALLLTVGIFAVLHATVRSGDLLAVLPRPLYRAGSAVALALAFAPQTLASAGSILEARRIRGRRTGLRAAPTVLVPVLLTALERALQYAESLDARGFGAGRRSRYRPVEWRWHDTAVVTASLIALLVLVVAPAISYDPYRQLIPAVPTPVATLSVLLLSLPAWSSGTRSANAAHRG